MSEEMAKQVAALIRGRGVAIFSGAGLSTESGLMDFRSKDGIWRTRTRRGSLPSACSRATTTNFSNFTRRASSCPTRCSLTSPQAYSRMGEARLCRRRHNAERRPPAPEGRLRQRLGAARKPRAGLLPQLRQARGQGRLPRRKALPALRRTPAPERRALRRNAAAARTRSRRRAQPPLPHLHSARLVARRLSGELLPARGEDERRGARDNQPRPDARSTAWPTSWYTKASERSSPKWRSTSSCRKRN